MTNSVAIANMALSAVGTRSTISDFAEDSNEARAISTWYDQVRSDILRAAPWGFAKAFASLALLKAAPGTPENPSNPTQYWTSAQPPPPWIYEYSEPDSCIFFRSIQYQPVVGYGGGGVPIFPTITGYAPALNKTCPFEKASDTDSRGNVISVILTNQPKAIGVFTRDVTDPNQWDSGFQGAMINGLAAAICETVTGSSQKVDFLTKKANALIVEARVEAANEGLDILEIEPESIRARTSWGAGLGENYGPLLAYR